MKTLQAILVLIILIASVNIMTANNLIWDLKGQVIDQQTSTPISYATVILMDKKDSSFIAGTTSDEDGLFTLNKAEKKACYIKFSFLGYADYYINELSFNENITTINLGIIELTLSSEMLKEVEITGKASAISHQLDKQVLDVGSNISAIGGTAIDALKLSPSIQIDIDGKVKLRGSSNFTVLLDGKPTALSSNEVLRQTPANQISKIEVITHPSVKYNAEGGAGIINIILKKGSGKSFNGIINTTIGTKAKYTGDLSLNLNTEKISFSAGLAWRDYTTTAVSNYYRDLIKPNYIHKAYMGQQRSFRDDQIGFRFGLNYDPDEKHEFSFSAHIGQTALDGEVDANTSGHTVPASENEYKVNNFSILQKPKFYTQNFNYSRTFVGNNTRLSINSFYSYIDYYLYTSQSTFVADANFHTEDNFPFLQDILNDNYSHDLRLDIDYSLPISGESSIEMGASSRNYSRFLDITFARFNYEEMDWISNPEFSNSYDFVEDVLAAYLNVNHSIFGFKMSAGLRFEYMDRILSQKTSDQHYDYDKFHFFPALSLSRIINERHQFQLSTSHRINRPDEYLMNPFPEFEDDYFYSIGNPNLAPEIVRAGEFGYKNIGEKIIWSTTFYLRQTNDKIEQKLSLQADDKIHTTFHNENTDRAVGLESMTKIDLTDWWSLNTTATIDHYKIWGNINESHFSFSNFPWNIQMMNSLNLKNSTSIQLVGYYQSKTVRTQGHLSDYYALDVALNQSFLKGMLTVNFQLKDVFNTLNYKLITETEEMHLTGDFINESPVFLFSVAYRISEYKKLTKDVETKFDM